MCKNTAIPDQQTSTKSLESDMLGASQRYLHHNLQAIVDHYASKTCKQDVKQNHDGDADYYSWSQ